MRAISSPLLQTVPGIRHGFGTLEEPLPLWISQGHWEESAPSWTQVHGIAFAEVVAPRQDCGEVDALYTRCVNLPIAVRTADCVPVLMARKDGAAVTAIHAGWKGTLAKILPTLCSHLIAQGEDLGQWVATIGPCISAAAFEVSEELQQTFIETFKTHLPAAVIAPAHRRLDLQAVNEALLLAHGVSAVERIPLCTLTAADVNKTPLLHSFRREKAKTRQYSAIEIISPSKH